ncbi:MAG TPA: hypothetical protein VK106_00190 [Balneolaceae bacterium]|nr:hypothetical protein [Balneolaceae bacterium]
MNKFDVIFLTEAREFLFKIDGKARPGGKLQPEMNLSPGRLLNG